MGATKIMNMVDVALHYKNDLGLNVLPIKAIWSGGKYNKKPLIPWTELQSRKVTDDDIKKWWSDYPDAGIAAVVGSISNGVIVIDCDSQQSVDEMETLLSDSLVVPCVKSISGKRHYYFKSESPLQKCVRFYGDMDLQAENSLITLPPTKGNNGDCYEWIVEPQSKTDFPAIPASLQASILNNKYIIRENEFVKNQKLNNVNNVNNCYFYASQGERDEAIFHAANLLLNGRADYNEIYKILYILAKNCNPPFPENELKVKIDSAIKYAERKDRNVSQEVREWSLLNDVSFLLKDCYTELKLVKKEEMLIARVTINAMCKEGILNKDANVRGKYSLIKPIEENIINLDSSYIKELPVKLPLGISDLVKIMPKNIIIVAGESNAGKTAFLLNVALNNMFKHKVFYFSSEMGGAELTERVKKYDKIPFENWKKCTFIDRASDFDVAIREDDINIIDFLEVHDEFYKIGGYIKKIFDKLNNGIAIVAIQKNKGRDEGLGGARSIEKARLYLSMSPGRIKIVKAKNWVNGLINPNNMVKDYKLAQGIVLTSQSDWKYED